MKNLPKPPRDRDRSDLKTAVRRYVYRKEQKGHDISPAEIEEIIKIYDLYENNHGQAHEELKGAELSASLLETIHDAYEKTQEGRQLYSLRESLFQGVSLCPVCGIDPPTQLDHQLPQSVFKPLSIHARNLVPLCHSCNHIKSAGFEMGDRAFMHVYYDKLPDLDFLKADIQLNGSTLVATFSIDAAAILPSTFSNRLSRQIEKLELNQRYQQEVNTYITSHAASLHLAYGANGQNGVRNLLCLQTRYETRAFHRNHWRPTLLRALLRHDEFTSGEFAKVLPIPHDMLLDLSV